MAAFFSAHGPTTVDTFGDWLAGGWFGKRKLRAWFGELGDRVSEVDVDGDRAYLMAEDVEDLVSTKPTKAVRLLPGFDQYVLGPGTGDPHVVAPNRRSLVSKQSGWISPVVVAGGRVCGTWDLDRREARISWFPEAGRIPRRAIGEEVARLATTLGRDLDVAIEPTA
jgi:hypothetical protein